jgi:hypothetical protein
MDVSGLISQPGGQRRDVLRTLPVRNYGEFWKSGAREGVDAQAGGR